MDKRKEIRNLIIAKTGRDPQDNFAVLRYNKDSIKVKVLWLKADEEIIELKKVDKKSKQKKYD